MTGEGRARVRINGDGDVPVIVVAKREPPRVQIRAGQLRFTFLESEAVALANALIDATEQLAADITTTKEEPTMTDHPNIGGQPDDDEALVQRVAARQSAHLGRPIPTDQDPAVVRHELGHDRRAMTVALGRCAATANAPDAVDSALDGQPPAAAYDLPPGVAGAILERVPDQHKGAVFAALDTELARFAAGSGTRKLAELCVHRLADATRCAIADSIADGVAADWAGQTDRDGQPFAREQIVQAAHATTDIVTIPAIIDRLREDLLALAGLPWT